MPSYASILNMKNSLHLTMFITDFPGGEELIRPFVAAVEAWSNVLTISLENLMVIETAIKRRAAENHIDIDEYIHSGYVSFHLFIRQHASLETIKRAAKMFPRRDIARLELPPLSFDVGPADLEQLCNVILTADYIKQREVSDDIFRSIGRQIPYKIECRTGTDTVLRIDDNVPLFDLSGPLQEGDERILPGGEIAYTGRKINGSFKVTGGLLATATSTSGIAHAKALTSLSEKIEQDPLYFKIKDGQVVEVCSRGNLAQDFCKIFPIREYPEITEVGFSFNEACQYLIHSWPSSSNEGVPGIHIAVGGNPGPKLGPDRHIDVHVDFISPKATVRINGIDVRLF